LIGQETFTKILLFSIYYKMNRWGLQYEKFRIKPDFASFFPLRFLMFKFANRNKPTQQSFQ